MALILTWSSLVAEIPIWLERTDDAELIANAPYILMLAENQLASEIKGLGTLQTVAANFVLGQPWISKPARWRETLSMTVGFENTQKRRAVKERTYEFCRLYWPDDRVKGIPRFWADWTWDYMLIVPTPQVAYPFELVYYERSEPLDNTHQTNWWTENAPEVLHSCVMWQALLYVKDYQRAAQQEQEYAKQVVLKFGEGARRKIDRATEAKDK